MKYGQGLKILQADSEDWPSLKSYVGTVRTGHCLNVMQENQQSENWAVALNRMPHEKMGIKNG